MSRALRIAILNRQRAAYPGGDLIQIDATIAALAKRGIEAEYAPEGWTLDWLQSFDLAHIFHCNFGWSSYNYQRTLEAGVPYVITPIFYPSTELGCDKQEIGDMLHDARAVLPFSFREAREIRETIGKIWYTDLAVIPNGTDERFHLEAPWPWVKREGVLCVAARAGDKNSHLVEAACEQLGIAPFTLATGIEDRDELARMYAAHRVFVNASSSERMSLTVGEALCAGCRVLAPVNNWGNEWYGKHLAVVDPAEFDDLRWSIKEAYKSGRPWNYEPNQRARELTWDLVAGKLAEVYGWATRG